MTRPETASATSAALNQLLFAARAPDAMVAVRESTPLLWSDFRARVAGLAQMLAQRSENYWALYHSDSYTFATALFGLLHAGKTVLLPGNIQPATTHAVEHEVEALLGDFSAAQMESAAQTKIALDPLAIPAAAVASLPPCNPAAIIKLLTSGSTGQPKIVAKTLSQLDAEIAVQEQYWGERLGNAQIFATVSHQHIYGLIFRLLWPLAARRVFRAETSAYLETLVADAQTASRAALVCSPAHLKRLAPALDLASLRERVAVVFSSGGALPNAAAVQWHNALGQTPVEIFGSTETGGIAQRTQPAPWLPLPGVQCRIDADGALAVRSSFLSHADLGDDEFFYTGDRARALDDGRFELLGRSDDIVKLEEKRIALREIDANLCAHTWVGDARTVLIAGARAQLGAVVVLSVAGRDALATQGKYAIDQILRQHLLQFHERMTLPRKWRYVDRLPETAQGKLRRADLLALFAADAALPGSVEQEDVDQIWVAFELDPNDAAFAGHFPGLPILPAVVQIDWVIRYAQRYFYGKGEYGYGKGEYGDASFVGIDQLKFNDLVTPHQRLRMHIVNAGKGTIKFSGYVGDTLVSRGRIAFGVGDAA